jgi:glycosyltransferase involved in cell wall biosynthesis
MSASLSVVIPSLNGASGVERCLRALRAQTAWPDLEVIVVDDGSTDATSQVAAAGGAFVVRHPASRGASAARNSGIAAASAPYVAFLDDDCEPCPEWASRLIANYRDDVVGVGGSLLVCPGPGIVLGHLSRHNPLDPQEMELAVSGSIPYRFWLYLRRQWSSQRRSGSRPVHSMPTANLSVRRDALLGIGGFDERIPGIASEDDDLCYRLRRANPGSQLIFEPAAMVTHYFKPSLRDTLRRRRFYGRGSALMFRKWPQVPPTFFPFPVVVAGILALSVRYPLLLAATAVAPQVFYPQGIRAAIRGGGPACLLDAYLQLLQEACDDAGFVQGLWEFRNLTDQPTTRPTGSAAPREGTSETL